VQFTVGRDVATGVALPGASRRGVTPEIAPPPGASGHSIIRLAADAHDFFDPLTNDPEPDRLAQPTPHCTGLRWALCSQSNNDARSFGPSGPRAGRCWPGGCGGHVVDRGLPHARVDVPRSSTGADHHVPADVTAPMRSSSQTPQTRPMEMALRPAVD
jgi:hypothetical protein